MDGIVKAMKHTNNTTENVSPSMSKPRRFPLFLTMPVAALLLTFAPLHASETDERIESSAKKSFVFKTYLSGDSIQTASKDGVVTLTGTVADPSHKRLAQDTVASLPGVKTVNNQLVVKEASPERSDTWLYVKVKNTLAIHRSVSATGTKVELNEGVVTLKGEASSVAAKDLATEYARDVEGIKGVKNEMTIAATPQTEVKTLAEIIDDASVTAQVQFVLLSHRSTMLLQVTVSSSDGVVNVGGKANSAAEKDLVTKLAKDVHGVKNVVNNMLIATSASN